ncbi:MAG: GNAT family N-acetyltransferase [Clostridia bacterium]|nr:GNAT family N-acetyltransferase [Clostridia bacterium]
MKTLETTRLILRDWEKTDLDQMFVFLSNPHVTIPEGATPCKTLEECKGVLDYLLSVRNNYAIVLKENGTVIGSIGLNADAKGNKNARNLGFCLAEEYWGRGIMSEALAMVIAHAKEITNALSATHNQNQISEHLLKKFGFQQVDVICHVKRKCEQDYHDEPYYLLELK